MLFLLNKNKGDVKKAQTAKKAEKYKKKQWSKR